MKSTKFSPAHLLVGIELNPGPRNTKHLDDKSRWKIVIEGEKKPRNISKIARMVGCTRKTVRDVLRKYDGTGSIEDLPGRGRKRKFTQAEAREIKKKAKSGKSATEIARSIKKRVTSETVRTYIKESGLRYLKKKKVERLSEEHKARRVEYAKRMLGHDWDKVLFSDEKTFYLGVSSDYAWQDPENRVIEEKISHPRKINVWGAVGSHMKSKLYYYDTNLKSTLYQSILSNRLQSKNLIYAPTCRSNLRKTWEFLQDNASYHKTQMVMETIENTVGDRWIDHPSKSPDLNPMENIWSYLDSKVKAGKATTIRGLKRLLTRAWNDLEWSYITKFTSSMDRRLQECIECKGERLDY